MAQWDAERAEGWTHSLIANLLLLSNSNVRVYRLL
jgi:hypothetical protein